MRWFLRLFATFRALEAQLSLTTESLRVSERGFDALNAENQRLVARTLDLESKLDHERAARLTDTQETADCFARRLLGRPVYGLASEIPVNIQDHQPIEKKRQQASDLVEEAERQFRAQYLKEVDQASKRMENVAA